MEQDKHQENYIELGKYPVSFGSVAVLGLGVSGSAVADFCLAAIEQGNPVVSSLRVYAGRDDEKNRAAASRLQSAGCDVVLGTEHVEGAFDTCIASPGISVNSDFYKSASKACGRVITEPEMAFELSPKRWIGITGTNGKTTTTSLCAHLLNCAGIPARAVGNIGDTCLEGVLQRGAKEYLVAELSSFQLASAPQISPEVAILLNITPDHVEWHGSHEAYIKAKMRLFDNLRDPSIAIVDVTDPTAKECAGQMEMKGVRVIGVSGSSDLSFDEAGMRGGALYVNLLGFPRDALCTPRELGIKGEHNVHNALAAAAAALYVGASPKEVREGLKTFKPLEHRIEPVGQVDGVYYYNDSKATNVDAALKSLTAFDDRALILLLGGHDKMTPLDDLVDACSKRCKAVVCYGESKGRFAKAFLEREDACPVEVTEHMEDALEKAREISSPGDVVCLSPACSSFDEFSSFEERGDRFKQMVSALDGGC